MKKKLTSVLGKRRWDSADPERAPPPLPLNPATNSPATRPNTSARIEEAAAAFTAKARENAGIPYTQYTTNPSPTKSPEKSLIKGHHHKRMQSKQSGNVRDLSSYIEGRSPEKERAPRTPTFSEADTRSPERSPTRSGTPTPTGHDTPQLRHSNSYLSKPILGENTPPSATMLALQNMRSSDDRDAPLSNITNSSSALVRTPQTFDAISNQILSLTSIATNLQREMANLSRRSKDNATDLISLKEATNARDEDIRNSLKELVVNLSDKYAHDRESSRAGPTFGPYMLDNKAHGSPAGRKNFSLPRIPSPTSFSAALDRDLTSSPSIVSADGAASIALLEKILREMGTKEGQETLLKALRDVSARPIERSADPGTQRRLEDTHRKVEEVLQFLKDDAGSRALVRSNKGTNGDKPPHLELDFDSARSGPLARGARDVTPQRDDRNANVSSPADFVNDDMMKILKRVKNSVAEGGGLTNEVKALVRELRGEVLGMGREIARKLEQAESSQTTSRDDSIGPGREEIAHIVEGGLAELKDHMDRLIHEKRRQSSSSSISRSTVNQEEVYIAVKNALAEYPLQREVEQPSGSGIEKDEILEAVREAWETYKPEIELQNFGLERDEILECLKVGLRAYQPQQETREMGASYEDVLDAVQKGLQSYKPPPIETEATITREEILMSVRECLESFEFPAPPLAAPRDLDLTRDDVLEAVREGLSAQGPVSKEIEFNREDLFDAVKAGLEGAPTPMGGIGEQVIDQLHELITNMRTEFKQYSAANGRDTEQVLDAMKDGLEELRADIKSYVDRAADVTGKDEIIDTVNDGFRLMQADIEKGLGGEGKNRSVDTPELLDAMEKEFEHLRETISKTIVRSSEPSDKEEILDAIRDISESERGSSISSNADLGRIVKDELEHLRETLATTMMRGGSSIEREDIIEAVREGLEMSRDPPKPGNESILSNTSELLDAFQEGVEGIRSDMEKLLNKPIDPVDLSTNYEILDTLKAGLDNVRSDIERLHESHKESSEASTSRGREVGMVADENVIQTEIEILKVMITQLRIKVEALDIVPPPEVHTAEGTLNKEDLADIAAALKEVHVSVREYGSREVPTSMNAATKDDTDAIETLLRNAKAKLDDTEGMARIEHIESLEEMVRETKQAVENLGSNIESEGLSKSDFGILEAKLNELCAGVEELQTQGGSVDADERVTKTDIQAVETLCLDTKTQIDELNLPDPETLPTKSDIGALNDTFKSLQEQMEAENELHAQAFEARKIEHGGLATKIEDVKTLLGDLREELQSKLDGSEEGLEELGKVLQDHHESMSTYATAASLKNLTELVSDHFDRSHNNHDSTKLETEERDAALLVKHEESRAAVTAELGSKIDEKFNELMTKYDDAQLASDTTLNALEGRDSQHLEVLTSTKAVAEDLKLLVDTLGSSVTETCDRMSDDSKTVFNRVDEAHIKLEELYNKAEAEHELTRGEIGKTFQAAGRIEGHLSEHQPAMLNAIQDVLRVVGQHYEHSQRSTEELKTGMADIPSAIPPLLPALPQAPMSPTLVREVPVQKEYDDSQVHDKLNVLMNHASAASKSFADFNKLDQIQQQVIATSGEISAMVATQTRLMGENHESKLQEAQEAAIALEKRIAQKEKVESEIVNFNEEKEALLNTIQALKREKDELSGQSKRLNREVSGLETALLIRREEMQTMEERAEGLEKRILEGVLDHARSLLISRPNSTTASTRGMDLKRVPSSASTTSRATDTTIRTGRDASVLSSGVGMALKRRPNGSALSSNTGGSGVGKERRILSSSYVQSTAGRAAEKAMMLAPVSGGLTSLKRSHSVKSGFGTGGRKSTWGGRSISANSDVDKENQVAIFNEEDERSDDGTSETGTERRTSFSGTSGMYTDSLAYGTGSLLSTDSAADRGRSASYASSVNGQVGGKGETIEEEEDVEMETPMEEKSEPIHDQETESARIMALLDGNEEAKTLPATAEHHIFEEEELQPPKPITGDMVMFGLPSDSGLGTDIPTASLEGHEYGGLRKDYFNADNQDLGV